MRTDGNSITNQSIKEKFVSREVVHCFSYTVEQLESYKNGTFWEEVENGYEYKCPQCGDSIEEVTTESGEKAYNCISCDYTAPDTDLCEEEPQEIFEWWIVTEWLYEKLKEKNQPVWDNGEIYLWGRCTTGQAILLDGVITDICREMEILDGQKYSWAEK